jgi:hypothetical protein
MPPRRMQSAAEEVADTAEERQGRLVAGSRRRGRASTRVRGPARTRQPDGDRVPPADQASRHLRAHQRLQAWQARRRESRARPLARCNGSTPRLLAALGGGGHLAAELGEVVAGPPRFEVVRP